MSSQRYASVSGDDVYVYERTSHGGIPVKACAYASRADAEHAAEVFNASGYLPTALELEALGDGEGAEAS
jgi:hypothetical protein